MRPGERLDQSCAEAVASIAYAGARDMRIGIDDMAEGLEALHGSPATGSAGGRIPARCGARANWNVASFARIAQ